MKNFEKLCLLIFLFLFQELVLCTKQNFNKSVKTTSFLIKSKECTQQRFNRIDRFLNKVIPFGPERKELPTNQEALKSWCRYAGNALSEYEQFLRHCFVEQVRNVALISVYSIRQLLRRYCSKKLSKATKELLNAADCLNNEVLNRQTCTDMMINETLSIIELKQSKQNRKIQYLCCTYHNTIDCIDNFLETVSCMKSHRNVVFDMINGIMDQMIDMVCEDFQRASNKCRSLPKLSDANAKKHSTSYIIIMTELLDSMDSF